MLLKKHLSLEFKFQFIISSFVKMFASQFFAVLQIIFKKRFSKNSVLKRLIFIDFFFFLNLF